jgi:ribosomal protein S18 acetylase RimI-like enzyme
VPDRPNGTSAAIVPANPATRLRSAEAADDAFLRELFKTGRAADFAATGLQPAMLDTVLEQQFRAQAAGYAMRFPGASSLIVVSQEERVGRLILAIGDRRWRIVDILLLPAVRGRGIGSEIIDAIARFALAEGAHELALSVVATNVAARRLYLRLGFVETASNGAHVEMAKPLST